MVMITNDRSKVSQELVIKPLRKRVMMAQVRKLLINCSNVLDIIRFDLFKILLLIHL